VGQQGGLVSDARWQKSSFSGNGGCVEVSLQDGAAKMRDSKNPQGGVLEFNDHEWHAFVAGVRAGEFDLLTPPEPGQE
jgi:hypothetical protein